MKKKIYRIAILVLLTLMKEAIKRGDWLVDRGCDPRSAIDFAAEVLRGKGKKP